MNRAFLALPILLIVIGSALAWYDSNYTQRLPIIISTSSGYTGTNFQIPINISFLFGMNANFTDFLMVNGSENAALNFTIETYNTEWAYFTFKADQNITTTNQTFYLYYGRDIGTDPSNPNGTYWAGNNFATNNAPFLANTSGTATWTIANSVAKLFEDSNDDAGLLSSPALPSDKKFYITARVNNTACPSGSMQPLMISNRSTVTTDAIWHYKYPILMEVNCGSPYKVIAIYTNSTGTIFYYNSSTGIWDTNSVNTLLASTSQNSYHIYSIISNSTHFKMKIDTTETTWVLWTNTNSNTGTLYASSGEMWTDYYYVIVDVDYFVIRNYTTPEPTIYLPSTLNTITLYDEETLGFFNISTHNITIRVLVGDKEYSKTAARNIYSYYFNDDVDVIRVVVDNAYIRSRIPDPPQTGIYLYDEVTYPSSEITWKILTIPYTNQLRITRPSPSGELVIHEDYPIGADQTITTYLMNFRSYNIYAFPNSITSLLFNYIPTGAATKSITIPDIVLTIINVPAYYYQFTSTLLGSGNYTIQATAIYPSNITISIYDENDTLLTSGSFSGGTSVVNQEVNISTDGQMFRAIFNTGSYTIIRDLLVPSGLTLPNLGWIDIGSNNLATIGGLIGALAGAGATGIISIAPVGFAIGGVIAIMSTLFGASPLNYWIGWLFITIAGLLFVRMKGIG